MAKHHFLLCTLMTNLLIAGCTSTAAPSSTVNAQTTPPVQPSSEAPPINQVHLDGEAESLEGLPVVSTDAALTLAVGYGVRDIPSHMGVDDYAPPTVTEKAGQKLINAFIRTGAFSNVQITGPGAKLSGRIYSLDVVLNPTVDLDQSSKSGNLLTQGLNSLVGGKRTTNFSLDTESSLFSFGDNIGSRMLMADSHRVSGATTSSAQKARANIERAWDEALDVTVPHIVKTVILKVDELERQRPIPAVQPAAPDLTSPEPNTTPAAAIPTSTTPSIAVPKSDQDIEDLQPLPELESLEELPTLD